MDITPYVEAVEKQKLNVRGIVVMQHGVEIARHHWVPDAPRLIYSASKSFTSIAIGMAVDEGKLSLTDRVLDAFPGVVQPPDGRLSALNLEHLLTMTRGHLEFTRPGSVAEALAAPLSAEPGALFCYDNACTFLASAMFTRAMGCKVRDFLVERLFQPLGIPDPVWAESEDGFTIGASGLEISTSSLALFAQFLLQRGVWKGKQLVSSAWIDGATRTHIATAGSYSAGSGRKAEDWNLGYGYQFWICRHGAYRGDGKDGQYAVVMPRQDAVAAITSDEENMRPILYALWDTVLPQL